jgi:hypothetical protein
LLEALLIVVAAIVWVVYGVGKLLFYTAVVLLFLAASVIELALALAIMPIMVLLRDWAESLARRDRAPGRALRDATCAGLRGCR